MPCVSVIIACYNQGQYLDEAVRSVLEQTFSDVEIVIVNDGSTEPQTTAILQNYAPPRTRLIHTSNQGLAAARNTAIGQARGQYLLPLDADDRIAPSYVEKALRILQEQPQTGIVYCQAELFGEQSGRWELPAYSLPQFLLQNVIFSCAMFRKADWQEVGGYKPAMKYTWSDWEFWLSLVELGRKVWCIPEPLFFYRRKSSSMSVRAGASAEQRGYSYRQVVAHHLPLYARPLGLVFRNRWILAGNEDLVPRLVREAMRRGELRKFPARLAAGAGLLAWAAVERLCRKRRTKEAGTTRH